MNMGGVFGLRTTGLFTELYAENNTQSLELKVRILESHLGKAMLINETLWEIIKQKFDLTDDVLRAEMSKIDLREGEPRECPKCHHTVAPHHPICIYCGEVIDNSVFALPNRP